jgi:hypothetical protein
MRVHCRRFHAATRALRRQPTLILLRAALALPCAALRARTTGVGFLVHCCTISAHASPIAASAEAFSILPALLVTEQSAILLQ